MNGGIAVHRWFAGGEGWALHPSFAGRERDLVAALDGVLKGPSREFTVAFAGGVLVGEKLPDRDCPDPKARARHPFILRAVYFTTLPSDADRQDAIHRLQMVALPTAPGHFAGLKLLGSGIEFGSTAAARQRLALLLIGLVATAVITTGIAVSLLLRFNDARPPASEPAPTGFTRPATTRDQPPPASGEVPYLQDRTSDAFQRMAAQSGKYDHPYVAYLKAWSGRLPETASPARTPDEIAVAERKLLVTLRPEGASGESARALIDDTLDYDTWRRSSAQKDYADREKPLPNEVRRFVEKFRKPQGELHAVIERMRELLRMWNDPDANDPRPFAVIDLFFARLTRPPGMPPAGKLDHPRANFLRRLPTEPLAEGQSFDEAQDLVAPLTRLLVLLDPSYREPAPLTSRALLSLIEKQMRYREWRAARSRQYFRDEGADLDVRIERECRRYE